MAQKDNDDSFEGFMQWEDVPEVDPAELKWAMQVGSVAAAHDMPMESPTSRAILIEDDDGELVKELRLADIAINRFGAAITQEFADDNDKARATLTRLIALQSVIRDERMKEYMKESDDEKYSLIHNYVLEVAATMPLRFDFDEGFREDEFFSKVAEKFAKTKD